MTVKIILTSSECQGKLGKRELTSEFIVNQGMIIFKNVLLLKSAIPGFLDYILKVLFIAQ